MGLWRLPEQRLGIGVSVNVAIEAVVDMNPVRLFPSEATHDVGSIPVRRAVIVQDRLSTDHRTEQKSYANGDNEPEMTNGARHCPPFPRGLARSGKQLDHVRARAAYRPLSMACCEGFWAPLHVLGVDQHGGYQRRLLALIDPRVTCPALDNDIERLEIDLALVEQHRDFTREQHDIIDGAGLMHARMAARIRAAMGGIHLREHPCGSTFNFLT